MGKKKQKRDTNLGEGGREQFQTGWSRWQEVKEEAVWILGGGIAGKGIGAHVSGGRIWVLI